MRGRKPKSKIRQNIIEILYFLKKGYGYEIYKAYIQIFPKVTMRSIYYNLNKGVLLKEFAVEKVAKEKGHYSWGSEAEKVYYVLGENARPVCNERVKEKIMKVVKYA